MKTIFISNSTVEDNRIQYGTITDCLNYLNQQSIIGLDIETMRKYPKGTYAENIYKPGLDPYVSDICMVQIGTENVVYVIDARVIDITQLKHILEDHTILKVGHNLKFEGKFFLKYGIRLVNVWDTMLAEKILYNGYRHSYSLSALMLRYLNIQPIENWNLFNQLDNSTIEQRAINEVNNQFLMGNNVDYDDVIAEIEEEIINNEFVDKSTRMGFVNIGDKPFTIKQILYGKEDVVSPLKIYEIQKKGRYVGKYLYKPDKAFIIENIITQVLAEMEYIGTTFSVEKWLETYEQAKILYSERKQKLDNYVIQNFPEFTSSMNLFTNESSCAIQWSSSKQVIALFKKLNIAPKERSKHTKRMEYTVGAKILYTKLPNTHKLKFLKHKDVDIESTNDLILQYLLFKKSEQLCTTFGEEFLKYVHPITGKLHPTFNQYMITSRLSSSSPNGQNIPHTAHYRNPFIAPKGYKWFSADYSAQEVRVAAEVHSVQKMIDFFTVGDEYFGNDFHSFTATNMQQALRGDKEYKVPPKEIGDNDNPEFTKEHNEERTNGKSITFKKLFGGSPYSLYQELGNTIEEAEEMFAAYDKGFPGLAESFEKYKKDAVKNGYITIDQYTGKKYFYPDFNKMNKLIKKVWKLVPDNENGDIVKLDEETKQWLRENTNWTQMWREIMYLKGKLERRGLNVPVQGASATMLKIALILIYQYRWKNNLQEDLIVTLPVHDISFCRV